MKLVVHRLREHGFARLTDNTDSATDLTDEVAKRNVMTREETNAARNHTFRFFDDASFFPRSAWFVPAVDGVSIAQFDCLHTVYSRFRILKNILLDFSRNAVILHTMEGFETFERGVICLRNCLLF